MDEMPGCRMDEEDDEDVLKSMYRALDLPEQKP